MSTIKPLLFVIMPFGRKKSTSSKHYIDFNHIYEDIVKPAAKDADVDIIRADEERFGGIIHAPMFERLLLAEIVLADLTTLNPNVFYELGIRHCARPRSTILMSAETRDLPFDIKMVRVIPYTCTREKLSAESIQKLREMLTANLITAKNSLVEQDSPLFQLIPNIQPVDLPLENAKAFRERVVFIHTCCENLRQAIYLGKSQVQSQVERIENSIDLRVSEHQEILLEIIEAYQSVKEYDKMITYIERYQEKLLSNVQLQEKYAFALNRRNSPGDRQKAITILQELINKYGFSSETCGLLGRIYKDMFGEALNRAEMVKAQGYLNKAIEYYEAGFYADPRDYYPGVNLLTLLYYRNDVSSQARFKELSPAVYFAVMREGGLKSDNVWVVATILELSILAGDETRTEEALAEYLIREAPVWYYETTLKNLQMISDTRTKLGVPMNNLQEVLKELGAKAYSQT